MLCGLTARLLLRGLNRIRANAEGRVVRIRFKGQRNLTNFMFSAHPGCSPSCEWSKWSCYLFKNRNTNERIQREEGIRNKPNLLWSTWHNSEEICSKSATKSTKLNFAMIAEKEGLECGGYYRRNNINGIKLLKLEERYATSFEHTHSETSTR